MAHSKRSPLHCLLELVIREHKRLIDAVERHAATAAPSSIVGPDDMGALVDTGEVGRLLAQFHPRDGRGKFDTCYVEAVRMLNESPNGSHWLPKLERLRECHRRLYYHAQQLAEEHESGLLAWSIKNYAPALDELIPVPAPFRSRSVASEKSVRRTVKRRRPTTEPKHPTKAVRKAFATLARSAKRLRRAQRAARR